MEIKKEDFGKYVRLNDGDMWGSKGIVKISGTCKDRKEVFVGELSHHIANTNFSNFKNSNFYDLDQSAIESQKYFTIYTDRIETVFETLPAGTVVKIGDKAEWKILSSRHDISNHPIYTAINTSSNEEKTFANADVREVVGVAANPVITPVPIKITEFNNNWDKVKIGYYAKFITQNGDCEYHKIYGKHRNYYVLVETQSLNKTRTHTSYTLQFLKNSGYEIDNVASLSLSATEIGAHLLQKVIDTLPIGSFVKFEGDDWIIESYDYGSPFTYNVRHKNDKRPNHSITNSQIESVISAPKLETNDNIQMGSVVKVMVDVEGRPVDYDTGLFEEYKIIGYCKSNSHYIYLDNNSKHTKTLRLTDPDYLLSNGFIMDKSAKSGDKHWYGSSKCIKEVIDYNKIISEAKEINKEKELAEALAKENDYKAKKLAEAQLEIEGLKQEKEKLKDRLDLKESKEKAFAEENYNNLPQNYNNLPLGTIILAMDGVKYKIVAAAPVELVKKGEWAPYLMSNVERPIGTPIHSVIGSLTKAGWKFDSTVKENDLCETLYKYSDIKIVISQTESKLDEPPKTNQLNDFSSMIKSDLQDTAYRIAASQLTKASKSAILTILKSQGLKKTQIKTLTSMLDTEMGSAVLSIIIGMILTFVPGINESEKSKILANEFRVAGITIAGNELADICFSNILPSLMQAVSSLSQEEKLRVEEPKEEVSLEEVIEAPKENSLNN